MRQDHVLPDQPNCPKRQEKRNRKSHDKQTCIQVQKSNAKLHKVCAIKMTLTLPNNVRGNDRPTRGLHSDWLLPVARCIVNSFKMEIPRKATNQEWELPGIYIRGRTIQASLALK